MLPVAYYFLQVVLCSGLLMGYYLLVLRNKRFHSYNRFYLLAAAMVSWIVPLLKIRWAHPVISEDPNMIRLLSVVADNNSQIEANITQQGFIWSRDTMVAVLYFLVAGVLLTTMLLALYKVYRLLKHHSCKNVGDVYLILTKAKGTPFSFFRYIFWNEEIDLRSQSGKQILQHELTHVHQKHSVDKIFIQLVLVAGWFNPFFWLLKREMEMIHEFIADKKAVANGDTASLAQMLLTAAYPQQKFLLTNPFFFSPIRRRLKMLTNNTNPRFSYIRRVIVLPLLAIVIILFSFRNKEQRANTTLSVATVFEKVMDEVSGEMIHQKEPVVTVSPSLRRFERAYPVTIDKGHGITDKDKQGINELILDYPAKPLVEKQPDLMIGKLDSIANARAETPVKILNFTARATRDPNAYGRDTAGAGANTQKIKPLYVVNGVKMAGGRLNPQLDSLNTWDVRSVKVLKFGEAIQKYGEEARDGAVEVTSRKKVIGRSGPAITDTISGKNIRQVEVRGYQLPVDKLPEFPGGPGAWAKYTEQHLDNAILRKNGAAPGRYTVVVSFRIDAEGTVTRIRSQNDPGYGAPDEAKRLLTNGPKWIPAVRNDQPVSYVHIIEISFFVPEVSANL